MGGKLFTTHFHDNHGPSEEVLNTTGFVAPKGIDEHLPPGFGTIHWVDVIKALKRIGFEHPVNFESGAWPGMDCSEGLKAAIDYWRVSERLV
jgi:sugar phosphate isomerase/epimerase